MGENVRTIDGKVAQSSGALCAELLKQSNLLVAAPVRQLESLCGHHSAVHDGLQTMVLHDLQLIVVYK